MFEITMAGPAKNALGSEMMSFLLERIREADGRPILIAGSGDAFSAGLNLKEVASLDAAGMEKFLRLLERLMTELFLYPAPTVALVNGHAIAGGCILALCCDHRVALPSPSARMGLNELALGLLFPPRILAIVRHRVPRHHIERVVLGAGLFDPATAHALGLVDEVAEDGRAVAEREIASRAATDPAIYAATKAELRGQAFGGAERSDPVFSREMMAAWTAPAVRERVLAVLASSKAARS
jgi:enoyl-CoA hydratase